MSAFDQSSYQVRFDWGLDGLARLAPADVIVVVDVLRFSTAVTAAVEAGTTIALSAGLSRNGAPIAVAAGEHAARGATILLGCLRNRAAVADAIVREQHARGGRVSVAILAAGERAPRRAPAPMKFGTLGAGAASPSENVIFQGTSDAARAQVPAADEWHESSNDGRVVDQVDDGAAPRFSVEDLLGAGAIIDALTTRGIDHASPEAAVASEGFAALRGAVGHLLGASGSGRELTDRGLGADVSFAAELDASTAVPVLRAGTLTRL